AGLEAISFPACLEQIGDFAFFCCPNLKGIDLSGCSALKTIGYRAFHVTGLEAISFPACLEQIGGCAFYGCPNLKRIDLSHCRLKDIGHGAFGDCSSFEKLILPPALEVFGENAISGCTNLRYLTLGKLSPLASASPFDPWRMNWGSVRYPCFSEVRFLGMDTSSLHPNWALAITSRNWLESFLAQLPTILDLMFVNLTPADLMAWRADLTPKLRTFAGSPGYQALLEMPDQTIARAWFRGRLLSIFNESFREVLGKKVFRRTYASARKSTERKYFRELKKLLSRAPFPPPPTTVFSETVSLLGCETRQLSPP
ncbi:MAG: leucine-rich repeat domain-containing protein, partial [Holosporales bacterium]|nr:leucine-rich repeat domain-containing protein [Holosporales bacterium]